MSLMKADQFFVHAVHATADYDAALVLTLLASLGATESPVRSTLTRLTGDANGVLTRSQAWRATNRLGALGLLSVRVHPRTWTEYHVDEVALGEFARRAVSQLKRLTGVADQHVRLPEALAAALVAPDLVPPTPLAETTQRIAVDESSQPIDPLNHRR
jgi:hypothetical protein